MRALPLILVLGLAGCHRPSPRDEAVAALLAAVRRSEAALDEIQDRAAEVEALPPSGAFPWGSLIEVGATVGLALLGVKLTPDHLLASPLRRRG